MVFLILTSISTFEQKISNFDKSFDFDQYFDFSTKISNFDQNFNFDQYFEF